MPDYQRRWWYVERPLPWLLIVAFFAVVVVLALAAIALGVVLM